MFVDASALVAMMTEEDHARRLAAKLDAASVRLTSPIALFETTAAVARICALPVREAAVAVAEFVELVRIDVVPLTTEIESLAVEAFARFGTGQRHAAQLNMGDCFAYACARHHEQPLLYTGNDFSATDVEPA